MNPGTSVSYKVGTATYKGKVLVWVADDLVLVSKDATATTQYVKKAADLTDLTPAPPPPPPPPPPPDPSPGTLPPLKPGEVAEDWFGNTGSGKDGDYVPQGIQDGCVTPDGWVLTTIRWEEGQRTLTAHKDGKVFGPKTHEANPTGGHACCADDQFFYDARLIGTVPSVRRWPRGQFVASSFNQWLGDKQFPIGAQSGSWERIPAAIGVSKGELFVVDSGGFSNDLRDCPNAVVKVFSTNMDGRLLRSWSCPRARRIDFDGDGNLWVLIQRSPTAAPVVQQFDRNGKSLAGKITTVADPTSVKHSNARLYVGDNSADQDVKVFDLAGKQVDTLGTRYGYLAGPRKGEIGPLRFDGPIVLGIDGQGNIVVASTQLAGVGERLWSVNELGRELRLESYKPDGTLNWRSWGGEFVDRGGLDEKTGDVFTRDERIKLDRPGGTYIARTADPFQFPNDRQQRGGERQDAEAVWVRNVGGKRFVFMTYQVGWSIRVYRIAPLVQRPSLAAGAEDGDMEWVPADEILRPAGGVPIFGTGGVSTGFWPDSDGNVWEATREQGLKRFRFQDTDPIFDRSRVDSYPMPAPFKDLRRIEYFPATDTLYLAGGDFSDNTTWYSWGAIGHKLARYDNWLAGNRTARWVTELLPYDVSSNPGPKPSCMSAAGDYVFVGDVKNANDNGHTIRAYRASDGVLAKTITNPEGGWFDMFNAIEATKHGDEYWISAEEVAGAKNLLYRWRP